MAINFCSAMNATFDAKLEAAGQMSPKGFTTEIASKKEYDFIIYEQKACSH